MYIPSQFKGDRLQAAGLMRPHPFASLVNVDEKGLFFITNLPLYLAQASDQPDSDNVFTLLGNVAWGNPHWRYRQVRPQAVMTFLGPLSHLSAKVYPDLTRVPTWNYLGCASHGPGIFD